MEDRGIQRKVLMLASVASMIDQFNMSNIRLLLEMDYEVHVACNFREGNTCDGDRLHRLKTRLRSMHVILHQWDCPRSIRSVRACGIAYRQILHLMKNHKFLWMHCHSPVGGALARIAAHRMGIPAVYTAHGFHFYEGAPIKNWLLYYPAEKLLARWTEVLLTVNQEDHRSARYRLKAEKVCSIPGIGIDVGRFGAEGTGRCAAGDCRSRYQIPEDAPLLLSVGELSRRKNHQAVLTALAQLGRTDIYYLICGQGELNDALFLQAERLGVAERIRMPGFQKDMEKLYQAADIFVFPSIQEGMPAALMEAMAAGLPCVVSDIRGNRELLRKNAGSIQPGGAVFSLRRPGELAEILEILLESRQCWQECGRYNQKIVRAYDIRVVEERMRQVYAYMSEKTGSW